MGLPFTTNTVTIETASDSGDKWEPRSYTQVASGVPCILSRTTSSTAHSNAGAQNATDLTLYVDLSVALSTGDRVTDEAFNDTYLVEWIQARSGLGLERREAGLRQVTGVSA